MDFGHHRVHAIVVASAASWERNLKRWSVLIISWFSCIARHWRQLDLTSDFFMCFMRGIQNLVVTYCPLSGFIPPYDVWQSCFWISSVSRTFLKNLFGCTASVVASSKRISPSQVLAWRLTPDFFGWFFRIYRIFWRFWMILFLFCGFLVELTMYSTKFTTLTKK